MRVDQLLRDKHVRILLSDCRSTVAKPKGHGLLDWCADRHDDCYRILAAAGTRDEGLIHAALRRHPEAVPVIVVGGDRVVYDCDGPDSLAWLHAAGVDLAEHFTVRTPRPGGLHLYAKLAPMDMEVQPLDIPGADLRHGGFDYVMPLDSIRGDGGRYERTGRRRYGTYAMLPMSFSSGRGDHFFTTTEWVLDHFENTLTWSRYDGRYSRLYLPGTNDSWYDRRSPWIQPSLFDIHRYDPSVTPWLTPISLQSEDPGTSCRGVGDQQWAELRAASEVSNRWRIRHWKWALDWYLDAPPQELTFMEQVARMVVVQHAVGRRKLVVDLGVREIATQLGLKRETAGAYLRSAVRKGGLVRVPRFKDGRTYLAKQLVTAYAVPQLYVRISSRKVGTARRSIYA